MPTTGYKNTGTAVSSPSAGDGAWSSPTAVYTSNNTSAQSFVVSANGNQSAILRCTNFGFTTSDIPSGSTITGIEVDIEARRSGTTSASLTSSKLYISGSNSPDNLGAALGNANPGLTASDAYYTIGGNTDLAGATLSDSDVRSSTFGIDLVFVHATSFQSIYVDHVRMRVHYTAGSTRRATRWMRCI